MSAADDRIAVLLIRAWTEDGAFRARITSSTELSPRDEQTIFAATPDQVIAAVRAWMKQFTPKTVGTGTRDAGVTPR